MVQGFLKGIQGSSVKVITTQYADNSKELQRNLIQSVLLKHPEINYLVGNAVAAEVAISELRTHNLSHHVQILSTYLSHGVYRGLKRNKILFSPSDSMVEQGKMAIIEAVRYLQHQTWQTSSTPPLLTFTPQTISYDKIQSSLSPAEFRPIFALTPRKTERNSH